MRAEIEGEMQMEAELQTILPAEVVVKTTLDPVEGYREECPELDRECVRSHRNKEDVASQKPQASRCKRQVASRTSATSSI